MCLSFTSAVAKNKHNIKNKLFCFSRRTSSNWVYRYKAWIIITGMVRGGMESKYYHQRPNLQSSNRVKYLIFSLFSLLLYFSVSLLLCSSVSPFLCFYISLFLSFSISPFPPFSFSVFLFFSLSLCFSVFLLKFVNYLFYL